MNIQSINTNTLVSVTTQRSPNISADTTGVSVQQSTTSPNAQAAQLATDNRPVSGDQLTAAVKAANDFVSLVNDSVQFSVDNETGKTVVKVIDKSTEEVLRQIPSEEMLAIAKALDDIKGLLVRQKA